MFETALKTLDFDHFASGVHKMSFADLVSAGNGVLLDVRAPEESEALALPLAGTGIETIHVPIDQVVDRFHEIPRDRAVGVFCPTVVRSSIVYAYLRSRGYENIRILDGGYPALTTEFLPGKLRAHRRHSALSVI